MNSQLARVAAVALWTAVCIGILLLWIGAMGASPSTDPAAYGLAACMATGCVGSVWFAAMIVALVVYGLVRR